MARSLKSSKNEFAAGGGEHKKSVTVGIGEIRPTKEPLPIISEPYQTSTDELKATNTRLQTANQAPRKTTEKSVENPSFDTSPQIETETKDRWLSAVVESSNDGIISYSHADQRIISWNPAASRIFGYAAAEIIGKSVDILSSPARLKTHIDIRARVSQGEIINQFETVGRRKDGTDVSISLTLSPVLDESGKVAGLTAIVWDITSRKEAENALQESEKALRASEERLRLLMESFTDYAMFSLDLEGRVENWYAGAESVFGYTAAEITGKPVDILFTPEDNAKGIPQREMKSARRTGRASDDRWHIRKDGSRFYVNGEMVPLYDEIVHIGYAKIARDLTEKNRIAEELQRAHDELEIRVKDRTKELDESNISLRGEITERKAAEEFRIELLKKLVTAQEDERRRIARDIHDHLGQRTTALRLKLASLMHESEGNEEIHKKVEHIQTISARLDADISFLAWELRPSVLDDLGLVNAIETFVTEFAHHFDVPAEFHIRGMQGIRLNQETETNLYRIVQEALNNAIKHADASNLSVLMERRENEVLLIIEDNGKGFDLERKSRRGQSVKGLGLSGIYERAGIAGGTAEIETAPGKGTTIFVRVPFIADASRGKND